MGESPEGLLRTLEKRRLGVGCGVWEKSQHYYSRLRPSLSCLYFCP